MDAEWEKYNRLLELIRADNEMLDYPQAQKIATQLWNSGAKNDLTVYQLTISKYEKRIASKKDKRLNAWANFVRTPKPAETDNSDEITIDEVLSSPPPPPPLPLPPTPSSPSVPVADPASNENEACSSGSTSTSKTYETPV